MSAVQRRAVGVSVGLGLLALATLLGLLISTAGSPPAIDIWWNSLLLSWDFEPARQFSLVMNFMGGGWFGVFGVPIGVAVLLVLARRFWGALFFVVAEALSAGAVQVLKNLFDRVRPEEIEVISDHGSFPSGHVANAATIAIAMTVLFPRLWVVIAGAAWVLLMAFSRTYLHAHWLTDTVGGALAGVGATIVVAVVFSRLLIREERGRGSIG